MKKNNKGKHIKIFGEIFFKLNWGSEYFLDEGMISKKNREKKTRGAENWREGAQNYGNGVEEERKLWDEHGTLGVFLGAFVVASKKICCWGEKQQRKRANNTFHNEISYKFQYTIEREDINKIINGPKKSIKYVEQKL